MEDMKMAEEMLEQTPEMPEQTPEMPEQAPEMPEQAPEMPNEEVSGVYVHTLKKPVTEMREKKKLVHTELRFDFASLTGRDMVAIDRELQSEGESVFMRAVHPVFLLKVCARAAGVGEEVIQAVSAKEYDKITGQARLFFLKAD